MLNPDDFNALLMQASPEELARLMGGGTLDARGAMAQQQGQDAMALRTNMAGQARTPWGAALGGVADMMNAHTASKGRREARTAQAGVLDEQDAIRALYVRLLSGQQAPGPMGAGDVPLPPGLS